MTDHPTILDDDRFLSLRSEIHRAAERQICRRRARRVGLIFVTAAAAISASGALAATKLLGHDVTPAELEQRATVVTNDLYLDCSSALLGCVDKRATHKQFDITASDGITFTLPSGQPVTIVPASGIGPALPTRQTEEMKRYGLRGTDEDGSFDPGTFRREGNSYVWKIDLSDGATRTIRWNREHGSVAVTDTSADGRTTTRQLHAGDVISLVPSAALPSAP